jgi:RNA polymerase sigma factor (sigma-70 family)
MLSSDVKHTLMIAMDRFADGEHEAMHVIYDLLAPALVRRYTQRLKCAQGADDVVAHVFEMLCRHRGHYKRNTDLVPWAMTIGDHYMIDVFRKRLREVALDPSHLEKICAVCLENELITRERVVLVGTIIEALSEKDLQAFKLVYVDGLAGKEAAEIMRTTALAIRLRNMRTLRRLRHQLRVGEPVLQPVS